MRWPAKPQVVRGRRVVTPAGAVPAALHIEDGRLARVSAFEEVGDARGDYLLDAGDLFVLPGLVDTHVHVNEPGRTEWEGFASATRAAAAGGVTTILDMPLNSIPATTTAVALAEKQRSASGQCHVDVGFIGGVVPGKENDISALWRDGVFAYKCFLVPSGVDEFARVDAADLDRALPLLARLGAPLLVHAELPEPIERATRDLYGDPRRYSTYLASRPPDAETSAIRLLVELATRHKARIHIVHVSAAESLALLEAARRDGLAITAETCPHYLALSADDIPDGATEFKCAPPIRDAANRERLWAGLEHGVLDCIVSDHSPAPPAMKPRGDFFRAWGGIASLELTLPAVWTRMRSRGLDVTRLVHWMSDQTARLVGLHHSKGRIAAGCDADLAIVDLDAKFRVDAGDLQQRHKLTPYAGHELVGRVAATYLRGELVYAHGAPVGEPRGRLLRR